MKAVLIFDACDVTAIKQDTCWLKCKADGACLEEDPFSKKIIIIINHHLPSTINHSHRTWFWKYEFSWNECDKTFKRLSHNTQ